jgi:hypothetical protein
VLQDSTRAAYELPLTVAITFTPDLATRLDIPLPAQARTTITLPGRFPTRPASVTFDPDHFLLARIAQP